MFVHVPRHVQSYFIWGEVKPMLLVVNIFTSPIGTDCGWSAPVVGLYTQAESFLEEEKKNKPPTAGNYM